MDSIIEVKGKQIPRELKKLYTTENKHLYKHMVDAVKNECWLPNLVLRIEKEGSKTTARMFDSRTNEDIK